MDKRTVALALWLSLTASSGAPQAQAQAQAQTTHVANASQLDLTNRRMMNGIDPRSAADFWNTWHLVTVRFRQDTSEQRYVYANDPAWAAVAGGKTHMPDGAMFAKVAFTTAIDPAFAVSAESVHATRVQLMLKDEKRYARTNGWGYALYVGAEGPRETEDANMAAACHACHTLVPERDYVFSRPTFLRAAAVPRPDLGSSRFLDRFVTQNAKEITGHGQKVLAFFKLTGPVRVLKMPLIQGSLDESLGPLVPASRKSALPYLLVDDEGQRFLLVRPGHDNKECRGGSILVEMNILTQTAKPKPSSGPDSVVELRSAVACDGPLKWANTPLPEGLQ